MFETALKSGIPVIGAHTTDLVNVEAVLHHLTGLKVVEMPSKLPSKLGAAIYYTSDSEMVTIAAYNQLMESEHQLIVLNPQPGNSLIFDAGELPTPEPLVREYLAQMCDANQIPDLLQALKGLSLKMVGETIMLTQARTGGMLPSEVRRTRTMVSGLTQGMYTIDTTVDFYDYPPALWEWLELNEWYFLNPKTPHQLVPRGLMLDGSPGVGKSMAAKAIANYFKVPLYRLDVSTALNKYQGASEERIFRILAQIEKEAPCVLLIDEVEKIFSDSGSDETGVISRILSQLLWWLAEHRTRVLTVMTTNKLSIIQPELYRPGRIDKVIGIPRLSFSQAEEFATKVFKSVIGTYPSLEQNQASSIYAELKDSGQVTFSHAEVSEMVYLVIKKNKWT